MASTLEHLGQPCRAHNILAGRLVAGADSKSAPPGPEYLVLTDTNEATGCELIFIDFRADRGRSFRAPAGSGSWALAEAPDNRLVVGTFYDGKFMVFDLAAMQFTHTIDFPGESYIWNLATGGDGRIYGGTYPGAKLGALDLATYDFQDCGAPAAPNLYLRYVSPLPDGRILCSFGMSEPTTRLYDPRSGRFEAVPPQLEGVSMGASWNGYFLAGSRVYRAGSLEEVDPVPFPTPPAEKGAWAVDAYMTAGDTLLLRQGRALYRYLAREEDLTLIAEADLRGGRILAVAADGSALGVRGQDYFVIAPGEAAVALRPMPVESSPRPTLFLQADDRGRIWGGPHFGQTLFWMDTRTREVVNTGVVTDGGGEVYDVAFRGGKVYAASYAGGDITEYDPAAPWDQWNRRNPRPVARVGPAYIRPTGGILTGPDGKLYSGWMARYTVYGGAVAITDPDTGATEVIENPLGEQAVEGLAVDGRCAYVGTSLGANGLPRKPDDAPHFGVIDLASRRVVFDHVFEGAGGVRPVVYDGRTQRVVMAVDGQLRVFDAAGRAFVEDLGEAAPRVTSRSMAAPGDGEVYYGSREALVAFDLSSGEATSIADAPERITNVAADPGGVIYISCGADVYRLRR